MTLWLLHLEPLGERYTKQWYDWFKKYGEDHGVDQVFVEGDPLTDTIQVGTVLDAFGTNSWKMTQMANFIKLWREGKVKPGDKVLSFDCWHPGLEVIPYIAELTGVKVELYGFIHAGSYYHLDFTQPMAPWAKYFEEGWFKICDKVLTGTEYHKRDILSKRYVNNPDKIVVTGYPNDSQNVWNLAQPTPINQREKVIIYTTRFDRDKDPRRMMKILSELWERRQDWKLWITTSRPKLRSNEPGLVEELYQQRFPFEVFENLTKQEYYQKLGQAKLYLSTAADEYFGICLAEATAAGVVPVVQDAHSHPELLSFDKGFLYDNDQQALQMLNYFLDKPDLSDDSELVRSYSAKFDNSVGNIYKELGC